MKRRLLAALLAVCMVMSLFPAALAADTYEDVPPTHSFYDEIAYVSENGLMNGVGEDSFDPAGTTTRAMVVTTLWRLEGEPAVEAENPFTDVADGKWYTTAVLWAVEAGIIQGYGNGKMGPMDEMTREQLAVIFYRYSNYKGMDVAMDADNLAKFNDADEVSSWATVAMNWAVGVGLFHGTAADKLSPEADASRGQIAAILYRYSENVMPAEEVTVTFDENYAGGKTTEVTVEAGETVEEPADPTRSGYDFKGWYTADGEAFDFNAAIEADVTVLAKWTRKPIVITHTHEYTYESNGDGTHDAVCSCGEIIENQICGDWVEGSVCEKCGFNRDAVAMIGETYYTTLDAAIAAAQAGDTVVLLKDVTDVTAALVVDKAITLDGNGKTIKATGTWVTDNDSTKWLMVVSANATVSNLTLDAAGLAWGLQACGGAEITLEKVTVSNVLSTSFAGMIINNAAVTAVDLSVAKGQFGSINIDEQTGTASLKVTGVFYEEGIYADADSDIGKITVDIADYVLADAGTYYGWTKDLSLLCVMNSTTNVYYPTLDLALADAKADDTITLLKDIEVTSIVRVDKAITLDGNGKTIKATGTWATADQGDQKSLMAIMANATVSNLTLDCGGSTVKAWGLVAYQTMGIKLNDVTITNVDTTEVYCGMVINGAHVTANNLSVAKGEHGSINIDDGGASSSLTVTGTITEEGIWADYDNPLDKLSVTIDGYVLIDAGVVYAWTDDLNVTVAKIGNIYYPTLDLALAAAPAGDTVVLLSDVSVAAPNIVAVPTGVTLDLNGHTLNANVMGTIKMNGGKFSTVQDDEKNLKAYDMVGPSGDFAYLSTNGVFTMTSNGQAFDLVVESGAVTLGKNWATDTNQKVIVKADASLVIPKDMVFVIQTGTTVTVEGDVTVNGTVMMQANTELVGVANTLNVVGANADVEVVYDDANDTFVAGKVAKIGTSYYVTLADAIAAAQAGDTVVLLTDIEVTSIVCVDKAITLDGNGKTIKATGTWATADQGDQKSLMAIMANATVSNLTLDCGGSTVKAWGLVAYQAADIKLNDVTITNVDTTEVYCGMVINGAHVTAKNLSVAKGEHGSINIDDGGASSSLTVTGTITEEGIWADYDNPLDKLSVTIDGYALVDLGDGSGDKTKGVYLWVKDPVNSAYASYLFAKNDNSKAYYSSVNTAIKAAADGDTISLLPGKTIAEEINPWGNDPTHKSEKSITILGADGTVVTGGMRLGYWDGQTRSHEITVENVAFVGKGLTIACQEKVVVENCTFTDVVGTAIAIYDQNRDGKQGGAEVRNNKIVNTDGSAYETELGIELREACSFKVEGNTICDVTATSILISGGMQGVGTITDNVMTNWALGEPKEGRALRAVVDLHARLIFDRNTMTHANAPEETFKVDCAGMIEIGDKNVWNSNGLVRLDDIYLIYNARQLKTFRDTVNAGTDYSGKTVNLMADIDLNNEAWTPIGCNDNGTQYFFQGTFEGNDWTISNFTVTGNVELGLFGYLYGAKVENLTIKNVVISGTLSAGALTGTAGYNTVIKGCAAENVTIELVPVLNGETYDDGNGAGGLVGNLNDNSSMTNCTAKNITVKAYRDAGGMVGTANGTTLTNCNTDTVSITLVRTLDKSYVKVTNPNGGGIVGRNLSATVTGTATNDTVTVIE